jgi:hypothetical protein
MENEVKVRGRPRGAVAKRTKESREAISEFVSGNLPRLNMLLDKIEKGLPKINANGDYLRDKDGSIIYLVKPDPAMAFKCISDITEYHLPRLARSDVAVAAQIEQRAIDGNLDLRTISTDDLKRLILQQAGQQADVIDVEPVVEVPAWLKPDS